jgi:hypothetical protein
MIVSNLRPILRTRLCRSTADGLERGMSEFGIADMTFTLNDRAQQGLLKMTGYAVTGFSQPGHLL